jgi:peptidoglycan/LPS O-acetylase OafA/YrhL
MTAQQPRFSHPKYRTDIDGLRAIAVLAVVVFHAFPSWMKGGFVGVDVFFVISGYLISTIIFENLDKGTFSFTEFYARRIKRIFPTLILVLVACFAFGWFTLLADEYKQLGKQIAGGAGFVSNIVLWNEAGYFDNSADTKPLLHLWSLGIEEQFYIVWPLLLWFAWKRKFNLLTITILVAIVSFTLNIKGVKQNAVATFYSPQTRFWELLSGSLLAWVTLYKKGVFPTIKNKIDGYLVSIIYRDKQTSETKALPNVLSFFGLLLLAYGFWQVNKELSFPGKWAVVPVLGAVLIIAAGSKAWGNRIILSNKVFVWIGLISFPLYLWHWPLLSFARIVEGEVPSRNIRITAVVLSLLFAWLTYKLVERPIRFGKYGKAKVTVLVLLMATIGYFGYNTYSRNGLSFRAFNQKFILYSDSIKVPNRAKECFDIPYAYKKEGDWFCNLGRIDSPVQYFAYGDSHALSLIPALEEFAINNKLMVQFTGTSGCPSVLGIQSIRGESGIEKYNCRELNERIFNYVKSSGIKSVILANRWTYYTHSFSRPAEFNPITRDLSLPIDKTNSTKDLIWALQNTVSRYSAIGVKVIFIEDNPQQIYEPKDVLRKGRGIENEYLKLSVSSDEHRKNQKLVNEALGSTGAKVVNLDDILCSEKICPLVANSKFLYSDDDHLSVAGSLLVSQPLSIRLKQ